MSALRLVFQLGSAELDVEVAAAAAATVGDLAAALAGGPVGPGTGLVAGDRFLAPAAPLAGCGLRQGDTVGLASTPPAAAAADPPAAFLHVVGGVAAGRRVALRPGVVVLGRLGDVVVDHPTVSARHARLAVGPAGCTVEDLGGTNGTLLDGRFVHGPQPVPPGSLLQLGAVQLEVVAPPPAGDRAAVGPPAGASGTAPFNRPPRRLPPGGPAPVDVPPAPPEPAPAARFSWAMLLAPMVLGAVMAVVFQPVMAVFALFGPVLTVGTWWEDRRRVDSERRAGARQAAAALSSFTAGLAAAAEAEAGRRAEVLPDPAECLRRAAAPSTRLWERRPGGPDVLRLRLGVGDERWPPPVTAGSGERLAGTADALASASVLPRSPVEVDLSGGRTLGVVGQRAVVAALLRSLVCQAAVHHGPADLRVAVLAGDDTAAGWDWAKWLPHAAGLCAAGREAAEAVAAGWLAAPTGPALLAVVDGDGFTEGRAAPVRDLLAATGVGAVVVASSADRLPASCTTVVELQGADGLARVLDPAAGAAVDDVLVAGVAEVDARACARSLAALDDPEAAGGGGPLPESVSLLSLLGTSRPTPGTVGRRWAAAPPASLAAVVGVGRDGPLVVDLVADGPHALVAGTTGSGKSELLRTLVASLAATYGPDRLNLVLVDYKGGSAFAECAGLPHVVGVVTDLDEHLGARALRSLEAELRHRESVLAAAGAASVDDHPALPRLLVVVDEFATLRAELPDFVDSLVGIAQRGRSLGVHLVLATQRPSGAVSDTIRANTNLRVALRVQDVPDSTDVIGTPQAAALDRRRPGRAFVRLGHAEVVPFQAALVSGAAADAGDAPVRVAPFTFAGPSAGAPVDGPSDLARLVAAAGAAWSGPPPRRPWLDPLPTALVLDDLPAGALGLADEPDAQRQVPFRWGPADGNVLLYGMAGSGTSTALASLVLALVRGGQPVHVYVVDFGGGALAPLAGLAAVGAVVAAGERERQERLVRMLRSELERRRAAVAGGHVERWPAVVLVVDNLGGLCAAFDDLAGMAVRDDLERLFADGPTLGMSVAAAADRAGGVPASLAAMAAERLVFRLADPYDDTAFGLPPAARRRPPGRAVHAGTGREVQVGLPCAGGLASLETAVASSISPAAGGRPAPVGVLPAAVAVADVVGAADLAGPDWFLPLGVGDHHLAPAGLRLGEGDHAVVAGPARSGKSTVLCTVARLVAGSRPDVAVLAVAPRRSPLRDVGAGTVVTDPAAVADAVLAVAAAPGPALVLVDDADVLDDPGGALASLLAARRPDVRVVAAGRADVLRAAYGHWTVHVRRSRQGVALRPHLDLDGDLWHTVLPRHAPPFPAAGRGYLVSEGTLELFQAAGPVDAPAGVRQ